MPFHLQYASSGRWKNRDSEGASEKRNETWSQGCFRRCVDKVMSLDPDGWLRVKPILLQFTSETTRIDLLECSNDQHAISVAEKSVFLANRLPIRLEDQVFARESTNEHEQRRFRQVKIREEGIDGLKLVRRENENIGFSGARLEAPLAAFLGVPVFICRCPFFFGMTTFKAAT